MQSDPSAPKHPCGPLSLNDLAWGTSLQADEQFSQERIELGAGASLNLLKRIPRRYGLPIGSIIRHGFACIGERNGRDAVPYVVLDGHV